MKSSKRTTSENFTIVHKPFNSTKQGFSIVGIIFSILFLLTSLWIGFILLALSISLLFFTAGIEINSDKHEYRYFKSIYGYKSEKWKSLDPFKAIVILKKILRSERLSPTMVNTIDHKAVAYEVDLVSESHRKKFEIKRFKKLDQAKEFASLVADKLNFPIETYNPILSEKTRSRRANRVR